MPALKSMPRGEVTRPTLAEVREITGALGTAGGGAVDFRDYTVDDLRRLERELKTPAERARKEARRRLLQAGLSFNLDAHRDQSGMPSCPSGSGSESCSGSDSA